MEFHQLQSPIIKRCNYKRHISLFLSIYDQMQVTQEPSIEEFLLLQQ